MHASYLRSTPPSTSLLIAAVFFFSFSCVQPVGQNETSPTPSIEESKPQSAPLEPPPADVKAVDTEASAEAPAPLYPDWVRDPAGEAMNLSALRSNTSSKRADRAPVDWDLELALQSGHPGDAYSAKFSPDGRYLATGGGEGSDAAVRLWNLSTDKEIRYIPQPYEVSYINFSPDGSKFLALGGIFETATGNRIHGADTTEAFSYGRVAWWSPSQDWKHTVADEWDYENSNTVLRVMVSESEATLATFDLEGIRVLSVAFAEDVPRFAIRCRDVESEVAEIRVFDWETQQEVAVLPGVNSRHVELSPDGKRLLLATQKNHCRVVDLANPESTLWQLESIAAKSIMLPKGAGLIGDSSQLVIVDGATNSILMLNAMSGEVTRSFSAPDKINAIAFDPSMGRIACAYGVDWPGAESASGKPQGIRLWSLATGEVLGDMFDDAPRAYGFLDFSSDGKLMASAGFRLDPALWDLNEGKRIRRLKGNVVMPDSVEFHPSNRYVSILGADADLRVVDLSTTRTVATITNCWETAWDPTGKWLGILPGRQARSADGAILLWDLEQGKVDHALQIPGSKLTGFSFNPTGTRVAGFDWNENTVVVWDASDPEPLWTGKVYNPTQAAFSPDGTILATASMSSKAEDIGVVVSNAETGELIANLLGGDVRNLAYSPDGRWLAAAENSMTNGRIFIFDTSTWANVGKYPGHDWIVTDLKFTADSSKIISADMSGKIHVRDRESGTIIHNFKGHGFKLNDLVLSLDGKTLATCSKDGQTNLWDSSTFEKLATVIVGAEDNAVIATPDGFYTMSPGARELVAFSDGMLTYPFEQFDLRLNRPDIVIQRLGRSSGEIENLYERAWVKRVNRMGFSTEALDQGGEIPTISILGQDGLPLSRSTRDLTIRVRAEDSSPLERLNLFINDVSVWGSSGRNISEGAPHEYVGDIAIKLGVGRNKIQISCHNSAGFESLRSTFEVVCTAPESTPEAYVLAIGVSEYSQEEYSLVYASKDARDIAAAFESNDIYSKVHTKVLTDSEATRDAILSSREFLMQAGVDDQVVLFVAGHGVLSDDLDYFFGTHDLDFSAPADRGLSYSELEGLVDGIPSRKKLILMDTCHSGELETDATEFAEVSMASGVKVGSTRGLRVVKSDAPADLGDLLESLFADLRRGTGAIVVTSSSGTEFSYEDEMWSNGVFSFAVLEGLRDRRAAGSDDTIKASQLMEYVGRRVTELTGGMQTPTMRRENLELDFPIWR